MKLVIAIGPGNFLFWEEYKGDLTAEVYARILDSEIVQHSSMILHDNDRAHTAQRTKDVLQANHVRDLHQPASSPDLQPIENFHNIFKMKLYEGNKSYDTVRDVRGALGKIFTAMKESGELKEIYQKLSGTMPNRLAQVIASRGAEIGF